jgi:thiol-disulfide isomerase/thioredoxin
VSSGRGPAQRLAAAVLLIGSLLLPGVAGAAGRVELKTKLGAAFPDMAFGSLLAPADYANLGLVTQEGGFRLGEIPGELLVLEFFSQYCLTCQRMAPHLEAFHQAVRDGDLAGRVRLLAVGVGSRDKHLRKFRGELGLTYPITADPFFERLEELGDPGGTPFTVFLLRRESRWILADFHLGFQGETELSARARALVEGRADVVADAVETGGRDYNPPLGLSEEQQAGRARQFLSRVAGTEQRVATVVLPGAGRVYQTLAADGSPGGLYARLASRDPVCDVCHAVHFLFAFDAAGRVRGFEPIHVTKYGNEVWDAEDAAKLEGRLRDRPMAALAFDVEVDAVSRATMSSALIFDEVRRTAALLARLP